MFSPWFNKFFGLCLTLLLSFSTGLEASAEFECVADNQLQETGGAYSTYGLLFWKAQEAHELALAIFRRPNGQAPLFKVIECSRHIDREEKPSANPKTPAPFCEGGQKTHLGNLWLPLHEFKIPKDGESLVFNEDIPTDFFRMKLKENLESQARNFENGPLFKILYPSFNGVLQFGLSSAVLYLAHFKMGKSTRKQRWGRWGIKWLSALGYGDLALRTYSEVEQSQVFDEMIKRRQSLEALLSHIDSPRGQILRFDGEDRSQNLETVTGFEVLKEALIKANKQTLLHFCGEEESLEN